MMEQRERKIRICTVLLILNLGFIWGNSLLSAELSQEISDETQGILAFLFNGIFESELASVLVRKAAHFTEFAALGLLLSWLLRLLEKKCRYALLLGMTVACVDEAIQFFVPGRAPGLLDVTIDVCGVITGMILLKIGTLVVKQIRSKQYGGKQ